VRIEKAAEENEGEIIKTCIKKKKKKKIKKK
jgi:hypothetical protein